MKMHPHDHILRYRFDSGLRPDIAHVVDLAPFDCFGECSCEDFQYRCLPSLLRNRDRLTRAENITDETKLKRCKHLLAARESLLDQVILRISHS